jgi:hypothetical protein
LGTGDAQSSKSGTANACRFAPGRLKYGKE